MYVCVCVCVCVCVSVCVPTSSLLLYCLAAHGAGVTGVSGSDPCLLWSNLEWPTTFPGLRAVVVLHGEGSSRLAEGNCLPCGVTSRWRPVVSVITHTHTHTLSTHTHAHTFQPDKGHTILRVCVCVSI